MKKLLFLLLPIAAMTLLSCRKNGFDDNQYLDFGNGNVAFEARGGTETIWIASYTSWAVTSNASWLTISPTTGSENDYFVELTAIANDSQEERSTTLTAKAGDKTATLNITQGGSSPIITFKDPRFLNAIVNITLGITVDDGVGGKYQFLKVDTDNDGQISEREANEAIILPIYGLSNVDNSHIRNLDEINYFSALTYLDCGGNELTTLNIGNNKALTYLDCGGNPLSLLEIRDNVALTYLDCGDNQLTSLDLSKNINLKNIRCGNWGGNNWTGYNWDNMFSSIDVSNNSALEKFDCRAVGLNSLDMSKNPALTYLMCDYNEISSLDVSNNTALTELWCDGNNLSSLDVSKNAELISLNCGTNNLTSLNLSKNHKLTKIFCNGNPLKTLTLYRYHIIEDKYITAIKMYYPNIEIIYAD